MNCPICNVPLNITDRSGIEIDYCPQCRGIWLDRGELDKILERSSTKIQENTYYQKDYYDEPSKHSNYYKHKKKKGFLDELFDF